VAIITHPNLAPRLKIEYGYIFAFMAGRSVKFTIRVDGDYYFKYSCGINRRFFTTCLLRKKVLKFCEHAKVSADCKYWNAKTAYFCLCYLS
jgi:hypothetical protein